MDKSILVHKFVPFWPSSFPHLLCFLLFCLSILNSCLLCFSSPIRKMEELAFQKNVSLSPSLVLFLPLLFPSSASSPWALPDLNHNLSEQCRSGSARLRERQNRCKIKCLNRMSQMEYQNECQNRCQIACQKNTRETVRTDARKDAT